MKKVLVLLLIAVMLLGTLPANAAEAVTIYAPGGRSAVVSSWDVPAYTSSGWFTYPVVYVFDNQANAYLINAYELEYYASKGYTLPVYVGDGVTIGGGNWYYTYYVNNWGAITSITSFSTYYNVVNFSGKTISVAPNTLKINGVSFNGNVSGSVAPGNCKLFAVTVPGSTIYNNGIRKINTVDSSIRFYDWNYSIAGTTTEVTYNG